MPMLERITPSLIFLCAVTTIQTLFLTVPCAAAFVPTYYHRATPSLIVHQSPSFGSLPLPAAYRYRKPPNSIMPKASKLRDKTLKAKDKDDDENETTATTTNSWVVSLVLPLWLVYTSNQWSRSSIYYLVDFSEKANPFQAMNVDLGFSEAQYGILASVVFTSLFAVASLGAGVASDRVNRKLLTTVSAVTWSVATLGTAFSHSYSQVVVCRILMGLACAFSTPTAYTLIRQAVPANRVALASSLYSTAVALGSGLASLSILLDQQFGWRNAQVIIAIFGIASVAACVVLLPDDPKEQAVLVDVDTGESAAEEKDETGFSSILSGVTETVATNRVQWLFLGSFLRFCSGLCIGVWSAPYYRMVFADQQADYAVAQAVISAVGASASGLLGGSLADWLSSTAAEDNPDKEGRKLWVPVAGSLMAAPAWYFAVHSEQSFQVAMAWLAVEYFVAECWFGPTISTLQATVGPKIGGTAQGLFTLTGAIANFAPSILGYLYGQQTGVGESSSELSSLLGVGVCFGYLSCAFCFAMAANSPPPPPPALAKSKEQ